MNRLLSSRSRDDTEDNDLMVDSESAQEILEALFVTDPQKDLLKARNRSRKGRIEGTCEWILTRPEYIAWRDHATPQLLMIVGEPGIGKTAMATFLVERLVSEAAKERSTTAYFFCNHAEPQRRTAISILKGLLHQILTRRPQLVEHAQRLYDVHGAAGFEDIETLWFLFVRVVQDPRVGQLTLLIDSLDNCDVALRKTLVRRLEELLRATTAVTERHHWRLLILTRPHAWDLGTCRRLVSGWTELEWMTVITMSPVVVDTDLQKLIEEEVNEIADSKHWSHETREALKLQLLISNGGTFLWISLALRCVADVKEDFVLRRIKRYSGSLRDLYVRVLRKIDLEDIDLAESTLHYVLGASRPLTLTELAIALYYRDSQHRSGHRMPADDQIDDLKSALRSCELLLRVNGKGQHATVEFIHQSVADFLIEHNMPLGLRRYRTSVSKAADRLATSCAAYLSAPEIRSLAFDVRRMVRLAKVRTVYIPPRSRDSVIDRQTSHSDASAFSPASSDVWSTKGYLPMSTKQMALLQYATSTWATASPWKQLRALPIHAMELIKLHSREQDLIFETAKIAISEGYDLIFRHLIKILLRTLSLDDGLHLFQAAIQYDESGIEPALGTKERVFWTEELPDAEAIYYELKRRWNNIVHAAAGIGLVDVVKFCIQHDDDVVLKDVNGWTALHLASRAGHLKVVKVLTQVDREKITIFEMDRFGQLPLHLAVGSKERDVVKALIKADFRRSTLQAKDYRGETALHRAVKLSPPRPELVKLLLDADAEKTSIYVEDNRHGRLPIHAAAAMGSIELVTLLAETDVEGHTLMVRDRYGETALDVAAGLDEKAQDRGGHVEVVDYLRSQSMLLMFGEIVIGKEVIDGHRSRTIAVRSLSM